MFVHELIAILKFTPGIALNNTDLKTRQIIILTNEALPVADSLFTVLQRVRNNVISRFNFYNLFSKLIRIESLTKLENTIIQEQFSVIEFTRLIKLLILRFLIQ